MGRKKRWRQITSWYDDIKTMVKLNWLQLHRTGKTRGKVKRPMLNSGGTKVHKKIIWTNTFHGESSLTDSVSFILIFHLKTSF